MKRLLLLMLAGSLALSMAACTKQETPPAVESASLPESVSEPEPEEPDTSLEEDNVPVANVPAPAGSALYRGTVKSVVEDDGNRVLTLEQAPGTDFGAPKLTVALDEDTKHNLDDLAGIGEGDYVEVYYGAPMDGAVPDEVAAIVVNRLAGEDLNLFNGTIKEITPEEQAQREGSILLASLEGGEDMLFHYDHETQFYLDFDAMEEGDRLNIFYSGASTRSIPSQATALEVRKYAEPGEAAAAENAEPEGNPDLDEDNGELTDMDEGSES